MKIVTYLFGFKPNDEIKSLTYNSVFDILRKLEGGWCRPFIKDRVGTVLFQTEGNKVFCRSIMKPLNINSIPVTVEVEEGDFINLKTRLALEIKSGHERLGVLLSGYGCEVVTSDHKELPFGSVCFKKKGALEDIACADFDFTIKINDLDGFKKAYLHGIGAHKEYGCGMLLIVKRNQN